ncbi:response regulator [Cognatishimia sp. WU-CL00825]|uniref:response regulator n=1 Tax=Cognatishimia sp. WU-CL00825 TaxID=3127658 RepID=UPI0031090192
MDEFNSLGYLGKPTARRPLLGLTVLVVEDSRFASEALRLICLKSGARIRRADSLRSARRHLRVYRPSVAVIDIGLPDGSGLDLIRDLNQTDPRVSVLIATSGDDTLARACRSAGADHFLSKPLESLVAFQTCILSHLPTERVPSGLRALHDEKITPDPMAYLDDLAHAAEVLAQPEDDQMFSYVVPFLCGIALSAGDLALKSAVDALRLSHEKGKALDQKQAQLTLMLQQRLVSRQAM